MKQKIFYLTTLAFLLFSTLAINLISAEVSEGNYFRYGEIDPNGNLITSTTPVNNVNVLGLVCTSPTCSTISGRLWPNILTSTNDYITLTYPTVLQSSDGYGIIMYKDGYIPFGVRADWAGNGVAPGSPFYNYLTKKQICGPKVLGETVTNNCRTINAVATIRAPISKAGLIDYYPQEIINQFTSNVDVTFEVRKDNVLVYNETKRVSLLFSEEKDVTFTYTPTTSGTYVAKIISSTDETRCLTKSTDQKEQQITLPACCANTDCGPNGFIGNPVCTNNDVFQNFITYTCNNPGQANSYCSNSSCNQLKQDCGDNITGNWSNICKNNNVYRTRTNINKGCANGACFSTNSTEEQIVEICQNGCTSGTCNTVNIVCHNDSECGTNGFIGNPFCTNNDVFQSFITYTCNNPGQANSYCSNSSANQLKQDCGDNSCGNWSNICMNNNVYRQRTCQNRGCSNGNCYLTNSTEEQIVEICQNGCTSGTCNTVNIVCHNDTECGTNGFIGNPFCTNNDVFQSFITYTCNNPGQANSYCSNSSCNQLKQDCGDNITGNWSNICKNNNVYRTRTNINKGCSSNSCFSTNSTEEQIVEECDDKCVNGECKEEHHGSNPCDIPGNPNCLTEDKPPIEQNQEISYAFINDTIQKLENKETKCKYYFCNTTWLWILIILFLVLLIILIIAFILWILGTRKRKQKIVRNISKPLY